MAKKQSTDAPEQATPDQAPDQAAPAKAKKPAPAKEAKAAPDAAPAAPSAPQAASDQEQGPKKKGRQPGVPPRIGKKLRNQLKAQKNKIAKEGPVPLRKAIQTLKTLKK